MAPLRSILVVLACACVVSLINAEKSTFRLSCMKIRNGTASGFKHYERPVIMEGRKMNVELTVPKCVGKTNGMDVAACDDETIPSVQLIEPSTLMVHRSGGFHTYIVVRITLHCESPQILSH